MPHTLLCQCQEKHEPIAWLGAPCTAEADLAVLRPRGGILGWFQGATVVLVCRACVLPGDERVDGGSVRDPITLTIPPGKEA